MSVHDVAAFILDEAGEMTAMKLQKLVYYSQAWSLVWDEEPLFDEPIQAWANGPVCPALYVAHRGKFKVSRADIANSVYELSDAAKETIRAVLSFYGKKSAQWLSDLTHLEAPWKGARTRAGVNDGQNCSEEIRISEMHEYYSGLDAQPAQLAVTKKEARIARKLEKALEEQEKSKKLARALHPVFESTQPRVTNLPKDDNTPRTTEDPKSIMEMPFSFDCESIADREDEWSWKQQRDWVSYFKSERKPCDVTICLNSLAGLKWSEVTSQTTGGKKRRKKNHSQAYSSICPEARKRWKDIERPEEELFRVRYGGAGRIWGVRTGSLFSVVWWDPHHKIYPTEP